MKLVWMWLLPLLLASGCWHSPAGDGAADEMCPPRPSMANWKRRLPLLAHAVAGDGGSAGCDGAVMLPHDDEAPVHVSDAASSMPDDGVTVMPPADRDAGSKAPVVVSCRVVVREPASS